jgi:starch synthase
MAKKNPNGAMHVVMASPEIYPYAKTGGLADVVGSLPLALEKLGIRVSLVMPAYRSVLKGRFPPADTGKRIRVPVADRQEEGSIYQHKMGKNIAVYFVRADRYFDRDALYQTAEGDYPDNAERFVFFSRAVLEVLRGDPPHILHCHDWQSALAICFLKAQPERYAELSSARTAITIHNLGYQGLFRGLDWPLLNLDKRFFTPDFLEFWEKINLLKGGAVFADAITTVSPTYAREIQTEEQGFGLEGVFLRRADAVTGILNGVDYQVWDPRTDPLIPKKYAPEDVSGKRVCKTELQRIVGLPTRSDIPLIGMISRLTSQKGFDILEEMLDDFFRRGLQLVLLGSGEKKYQDLFSKVPEKYPGKAAVKITFDDGLAHRIEAGSDMFLMPSRYEPSGLNQLYSLRYGTIPIVRATGGLKDSIEEFNPGTGKGTGFLFEPYTGPALLEAVDRALKAYAHQDQWLALMANAMRADFSWDRSAKGYVELYRKLLR